MTQEGRGESKPARQGQRISHWVNTGPVGKVTFLALKTEDRDGDCLGVPGLCGSPQQVQKDPTLSFHTLPTHQLLPALLEVTRVLWASPAKCLLGLRIPDSKVPFSSLWPRVSSE